MAGRLLLRECVAEYFQLAPKNIQLDAQAPVRALAPDGSTLCFVSISHSGRYLAVAFADCAVGIDCEQVVRRRDWCAIADAYFAKAEADYLKRLPPEQAQREFALIWSCKEAQTKCTGIELGKLLNRALPIRGVGLTSSALIEHGGWWGVLTDDLLVTLVSADRILEAPTCHYRLMNCRKSPPQSITLEALW